MNKICTSLEQSKKLIELGIDVSTADMCHEILQQEPQIVYKTHCRVKSLNDEIPAWSLTALLELKPKENDVLLLYIKIYKQDLIPSIIDFFTDGSILLYTCSDNFAINSVLSELMIFCSHPFSSNNCTGFIFKTSDILSMTSGGGKDTPHSIPLI